MVEMGQIEKPKVEAFHGKRKVYCVANVFPGEKGNEEYRTLFERYWDEVARQLAKIEAAGKTKKIFCELISEGDEEALNFLKAVNERAYNLVKEKMDQGIELVPLEDREIFGSYTDWGNCLRVVFTEEVFKKVLGFYTEAAEKRLGHSMETIKTKLEENEAGLLIMKDEDRARLQFPKDIEVFLITPPAYDDILRWYRDARLRREKEEAKAESKE